MKGRSMLKRSQLECITDWLQYCRLMSDDNHRRAVERLDLDEDLRFSITKEQKRRTRELTRLIKAIQTELKSVYGHGEGGDDDDDPGMA